MARLPDVQDLGPRPIPQSNRQVATVRNAGAVGEAVASLGVKMGEVIDHLEEVHDEADVRRLDGEHDEAIRKIRETALAAQGEDAPAARAAAEEQIATLNEAVLARARSNRSRIVLERIVQPRASTERAAIGRHATNESVTVLDGQFVARRDQYIRRAQEVWDNPEAAEQALTVARGEVANRGEWRGWSPEQVQAEQAQVTSTIRAGIAERMVSAGDYEGALAYVDAHRGEIDHQAENELRAAIRGPMLEDRGEAIVNALPAITGAATPAPVAGQPAPSPAPARDTPGRFAIPGGFTAGDGVGARRGNSGRGVHHGLDTYGQEGTPFPIGRPFEVLPGSHRQAVVHDGRDGGNIATVRVEGAGTWQAMHLPDLPAAGRYEAGSPIIRSGRSGFRPGSTTDPHVHWQPVDETAWAIYAQGRRAVVAALTGGPVTAGATAQGSPVPTGRQVDYTAARQQIEAMGLPRDERRAALTALDRRVSTEDRIIARDTETTLDELNRRLVDIQSNGGRLTSITQIDAGLLNRVRRYAPEHIVQIQNTIEANNRPREPAANSSTMANLVVMAGEDPAGFLRISPELYRGRITDGEVLSLHRSQMAIRERAGPQPSQILSMINAVLPETGLVPTHASRDQRQNGETEAQARDRIRDGLRTRIFSAVGERLRREFPTGSRVTEQDILNAVRAETVAVTFNGQRMNMFEARERGAQTVQVMVPARIVPLLQRDLQRIGMQDTEANRVRLYLRLRTQYDAQ